jgi:hypothetical protein
MSEHVLSSKMYYGIWVTLMVLTVVTAGVACRSLFYAREVHQRKAHTNGHRRIGFLADDLAPA